MRGAVMTQADVAVVAPAAKPDTKVAAAWITVPARPDAPPLLMQAVNHAD
jgi:hypothetical protein